MGIRNRNNSGLNTGAAGKQRHPAVQDSVSVWVSWRDTFLEATISVLVMSNPISVTIS